jgi:ribosomal protein S12 methylthiotransferase
MNRHGDRETLTELMNKIREKIEGVTIRTTFIAGFPGESEEEFNELCEFVDDMRFERMGCFAYSEEEGTYSAKHYEDDVPEDVKQQRLDELMDLQQEISAQVQAQKVGSTMKVIIDRKEGEYYVGRTEFCSPEVDPEVLIPVVEGELKVGEFYQVNIKNSDDFDLYGSVC